MILCLYDFNQFLLKAVSVEGAQHLAVLRTMNQNRYHNENGVNGPEISECTLTYTS